MGNSKSNGPQKSMMPMEIQAGSAQNELTTEDMKNLRESIIRYCVSDKFKNAGKFVQETLNRLKLYVTGQNYRKWEEDCEKIDAEAEEEKERAVGTGNASLFGCFTASSRYYRNQVALVLHRYRTVKDLFELATSDDLCALYTHISMVSHQVVGSADFPVGGWPSSSLHKAFVELQKLTIHLPPDRSARGRIGGRSWKDELKQSRRAGREDGYKQGREDGYKQGCEDGYKQGCEDGYKQGVGVGKNFGRIEAETEQIRARLEDKGQFIQLLGFLKGVVENSEGDKVQEQLKGIEHLQRRAQHTKSSLNKRLSGLNAELPQLRAEAQKTPSSMLWQRANMAGATPVSVSADNTGTEFYESSSPAL